MFPTPDCWAGAAGRERGVVRRQPLRGIPRRRFSCSLPDFAWPASGYLEPWKEQERNPVWELEGLLLPFLLRMPLNSAGHGGTRLL